MKRERVRQRIRVLNLLMVLLIGLSLIGCGQTAVPVDSASPSGNEATAVATAAVTESAAVATTEAPAPETPAPRDPVKIKVLVGGDKVVSSRDDEIGQMIFDKFQTEIEFVPYNESHFEKALMMLASQDFADLDIINTALDDVTKKYIAADIFVNLDDYRDKLSNFYAFEKDLIPYWRNFDMQKGDLYVWQSGPDQIQMTNPPLDIITRVDALEACGWPKLDTTDDYVAFLKQAMEKIPTSNGQKSIGMSFFYGDPVGPLLSTYLPRHSGFQHFYKTTGLIDVDAKSIVPLATHPYAKATTKFYNTLFREGIMDKEAWTDGFTECQAKMESGVPITVNFMTWTVSSSNAKAAERGTPDMQYIVTPIRLQIAKDEGRKVRYELFNGVRPDETQGILKTSKNVDRIIELVDFFASEEMTIRTGWGVEGRDYTVENGQRICTPEFLATVTGTGASDYLDKIGINKPYSTLFACRRFGLTSNGQSGNYSVDPTFNMTSATETQKKAYKALGWSNLVSGWRENPAFKFEPFEVTKYVVAANIDPATEVAKTEEKIKQYMDQQLPIIITSKTEAAFESKYQQMVDKVAEMGIDKVITLYNEQLKTIDTRIAELAKR